jgi:hypothetical protein
MSTPRVTETRRRLEPVGHDTFIDDLAPSAARAAGVEGGQRQPGRVPVLRVRIDPRRAGAIRQTLLTP